MPDTKNDSRVGASGDPEASLVRLIRACARDEPGAWPDFVQMMHAQLAVWVRYFLGSIGWREARQQVPDLVQEVYLRLLDQDRKVLRSCRAETDKGVRAYLRQLCSFVVHSRLRVELAKKRYARYVSLSSFETTQVVCEEPGPETTLWAAERRREILDASVRVSQQRHAARNRRVVELALLEGWSSRDIGRALEPPVTASAIDSLISRMRRRLAREGIAALATR